MSILKTVLDFIRLLFVRSKPALEVEIEIVQFLAQRGESTTYAIHEYLNRDFDFNDIKPYTFVSFGIIYVILAHLEEQGIVRCRTLHVDDRKQLAWTLTGRGPRKSVKTAGNISLQPHFA